MHARFLLFGLAALLSSLLVSAPAHGEIKLNNQSRIVLLGDSITDGDVHRLLVRDALASAGLDGVRVYNAGVAGNTARQMRDRFGRDVLPFKPHVVTINAGVNDSGRPIPVEEYAADIMALIEVANAKRAAVVLVTPTPIGPQGRPQMQEYVVAYANWMRAHAKKHNLPLADAHAHLADALSRGEQVLEADHVHPNLAGQRLIARAILDALGATGAVVPDAPQVELYPGTLTTWRVRGVDKNAVLTADLAASLDPAQPDFMPLILPQQPGDAGDWAEFVRACGVGIALSRLTDKPQNWCVTIWPEAKRRRAWLNVGGTITKLFLNGQEIELHTDNGWHPGKQRIRVLLSAGENRIVAQTSSDLWVGITDNRVWD